MLEYRGHEYNLRLHAPILPQKRGFAKPNHNAETQRVTKNKQIVVRLGAPLWFLSMKIDFHGCDDDSKPSSLWKYFKEE
jgi:hypothetical protein